MVATDNVAPLIGTVLSGMKVYNLATAGAGATAVTPGEYYYDGTKWVRIAAEGSASSGGAEPWYNVATQTGATANTQDVYQMGKVGIGKNNPQAQLDVAADALINGVTVGRGGASVKNSTAVGNNALKSITSGSNNTAMGYESLTSCTTGNSNVGVGVTLMDLTTGAVNTGIGFGTLNGLVTGSGNTAVGSFSLNSAKGIGNTAIGSDSGLGQKNGDFNIMIGRNANVPDINGSNQMSIGNLIYGTGMSTTSKYMGNIGIGTDTPSMKLHVFGTAGYLLKVQKQSGNGGSGISVDGGITDWGIASTGTGDQAAGQFWVVNRNNGNIPFAIAPDNNIGMGTYTPRQKLEVNGSIQANSGNFFSGQRGNGYYLSLQNDRNVVIYDAGAPIWIAGTGVSDIRTKKDITAAPSMLDRVNKLQVINYKYKAELDDNNQQRVGVIAQEVLKEFPEYKADLIYHDEKADRYVVHYDKLTVLLLKSLQEQQTQIETQNAKIETLEKQMKALMSK